MEALILPILTTVREILWSHYSNEVVIGGFEYLVNYLIKEDEGNQDLLERSLQKCLLASLQQIALEVHQEILPHPQKWRGIAYYPEENREILEQLDNKIKLFAKELKKLKKAKSVEPIFFKSLDKVALLLTKARNFNENQVIELNQNLSRQALNLYGDLPESYAIKVTEDLFAKLSDEFANELTSNSKLQQIFQTKLLASIAANTAQEQMSISQLASEIKQLKNSPKTLGDSSSKPIAQEVVELEKTAEGTIRIKLPIEEINGEQLAILIERLQKI
ncbi:MAG: hypothetical protein SAJ37_10930 [Oscillatoria sp. PMC 1068.18]|nr:hypothetical protein [Oscillatoria sp. PMC 1076.18]MEC4989254.1 hypothetical protein [Oscillatoria sp. PMC 1068.18]